MEKKSRIMSMRLLAVVVLMCVLVSVVPMVGAEEPSGPVTKSISVIFGSTKYILDGVPFDRDTMIYNDTAYLPAAYLAAKLGLTTFWDRNTNTTTLTSGTGITPQLPEGGTLSPEPVRKNITAIFGSTKYILDGVPFDQETLVYNGVAYLPAAYLARKLGLTASWDAKTNTTTLTSK